MSKDNYILLCVGNFDSNTGYAWKLIESLWVSISDTLHAKYYEVIACYPTVSDINPDLIKHNITVHEHDFSTRLSTNLLNTLSFIVRHRVKVIYLTDRPFFSLTYCLFRLLGVKKILMHDHTPGYRPPLSKTKISLKRILNSVQWFTADIAIGVSPYVCKRLSEVNGVPTKKIFLVTNGIKDTSYIKEYYETETIKIITVARANYYKGIDFALKTIAKLKKKKESQIEYHLIGDGADLDEFKKLAKKLNIDDIVFFHGKRNDIEETLPTFDIAFHPSKGEAMCLAIVEYMRAGLPILVSNNLSVNSILNEKEDSFFYIENNQDDATDKLEILIRQEDKRKFLGFNSRANYLNKYQHKQMIRSFSNMIKESLNYEKI